MEENNKTETKEQVAQERTYTQSEVNDMLQREGDRRVTEALKKQQKKFDEAQKLASMSTEEKNQYEYNQKVQALEAREREIARKELVMETEKQLAEKGLPAEAASFIVAIDAEKTKANMKSFESIFNKAVEAEINKRVATGAPKVGTGNNQSLTKEQFKKMNLSQQAQIYRTNPELYKALTEY